MVDARAGEHEKLKLARPERTSSMRTTRESKDGQNGTSKSQIRKEKGTPGRGQY